MFNADIIGGGGTPAWGTEMGQGDGYYFHFEDMSDFFTGMVYNAVPDTNNVSCPLGKGGNQRDDYDFVIASVFDKVYVNNNLVRGAKFLLLIVKKLVGAHHVGRRALKYNPHMSYRGEYVNERCFSLIPSTLGIAPKAAWFINEINIINQDELHFTAYVLKKDGSAEYLSTNARKNEMTALIGVRLQNSFGRQTFDIDDDAPRQIIWYGAPGTGKSFTVNNVTNKSNSVRTTFHPDTDYASFVGTYKPTLRPVKPMYQNIQGRDEEISYKFTPQVFLKAYVNAWRNYAENPDNPTPYYLVIEEINRGNCAQIFGDLFQLLDREDNGASTYEIVPDTDIEKFLKEDEDGFVKEEAVEDFTVDIKEGKILRLPSNLFIYATMNTSDQSLFPIDSAFKRRWEWRYTPIAKPAEKNWTISANNRFWSWWEFLKRINFEIGKATESEDKKLGYFFARAKRTEVADIDNNNGTIEASTFVSKVLFYLWNDVIKDNDFNTDILKDANGKDLDFTRFFKVVDGETTIDEVLVENFITNVMKVQLPDEPDVVEEIQDNSSKSTFSINGELVNSLSSVASTTIKKYIELNQTATADDVFNAWSPYSQYSTHSWIISKDEKTKRAERLQCGDGSFVWVNKDGWMRLPNSLNRDTIQEFMDAVNSADFGITIIENKE